MTKLNQVYKCELCKNIVEVVGSAAGTLVCCGQPMKLMDENTKEGAGEKHIPVVEHVDGGVLVKVGEVEHPMQPEHYIMWIELLTNNKVHRAYLNAGEKPETMFDVKINGGYEVREFCNLHGLWKVSK